MKVTGMTFSYKAAIMKKRLADIAAVGRSKWHSESSAAGRLTAAVGIAGEILFVWVN